MTNDEAMNSAREMLIYRKLEELNKVKQELNKVSQELEFYKKALELACDDIRKRDCSAFSYTNFKCGVFRETYEACIRNIEFENYYLKKARGEHGN